MTRIKDIEGFSLVKDGVVRHLLPKSFGTLFRGEFQGRPCCILVHSRLRGQDKFLADFAHDLQLLETMENHSSIFIEVQMITKKETKNNYYFMFEHFETLDLENYRDKEELFKSVQLKFVKFWELQPQFRFLNNPRVLKKQL